ncbi:MAG: hypothetical protein IJ877_01260 [Candidatus Gastranaerophilales bacterium]|nr:hypothetical protein [Candidatus Gastranaerophilales bacterium]
MTIKQKQNFDKEANVYENMLHKCVNNTGFDFEYIQEYKVLDFKNEIKNDKCYDPDNVKIMQAGYSKKLFQSSHFKDIKISYRFFVPNNFQNLLRLEKYLKNCPLGANYYLIAKKY